MWTLTRSVRLNIPSDQPPTPDTPLPNSNSGKTSSGYSGIGTATGFPAHYQFDVQCRGDIEQDTSYVKDIKAIDRAVVSALHSTLTDRASHRTSDRSPLAILAVAADAINASLGGQVSSVRWWVTPYHSYEMGPRSADSTSNGTAAATTVLIRQRFDFSASHRLHNPAMTAAENAAKFGKCNNPAGHGHNYVVEPTVRVVLDNLGGSGFTHGDLTALTSAIIIDRFDHKHLNVDTHEFKEPGGVLPTVENIARVFFELLSPHVSKRCPEAELIDLTVWETDRTSSTYPG
jgi:6-pyruvoyltetrahydropterin/6-carboxytetrahydropterin synthase